LGVIAFLDMMELWELLKMILGEERDDMIDEKV
jgi:hypothetical protein